MEDALKLADVLWVPSLPDEGWASMDLYWSVLEDFKDDAARRGFPIQCALPKPPEVSRASPRPIRALRKYVTYPRRVRGLSARADIVHVLDHSYGRILPRIAPGTRSLITVFDIIPMLKEGTLSDRQLRRFERNVGGARVADRVIAVSRQTRDDLIHRIGVDPERIVVAYPGTDLTRFSKDLPGGPAIPGLRDGEKAILSVGTLDPKKNLISLAEIFRPLATRFRAGEVRFVRAGALFNPDLRKAITSVIGEDALLELGPTFGDDLVAAYQRSSAFMMPSVFEGFSFTMMEAMAASCPVVSNRCSTNSEVGGDDAALYYDEGDAATAAAQLARILDDDDFAAAAAARGLARAGNSAGKPTGRRSAPATPNSRPSRHRLEQIIHGNPGMPRGGIRCGCRGCGPRLPGWREPVPRDRIGRRGRTGRRI